MPRPLAGDRRRAARDVLKDVFGFDDFRPGQEATVAALLDGRNTLTVMPTGSGKSLCYQVPALVLGGLTVVVSPLIALMQDQVAALRLAGVAADCINSSKPRGENVAAWRRVAAGHTRLLYLAPERLMTERMLAALGRLPVRLIAVDEAHCISQWGPAFRPEYEALGGLPEAFPGVPIAAMTATADRVTRDDIAARLFDGEAEQFVLGFDRPNIRLAVEPKRDWKRQLQAFIARHRGESGIVYCLSRRKTEETAGLLAADGVRAIAYHAGMDKEEREARQNAFMTEPGTVMVATIAFGMGIDKADVRFVFHTDLPASVEAYYQEIGRAGRDGAPAEAHMLYGLGDIAMRRQFIAGEESGEERKRREHARLEALLGYCEAPACRRMTLLDYFGEAAGPCGNCDCCLHPVGRIDGSADARLVLSAIQHTGERFGAAHVIDILRGRETEKVQRFGHHRLEAFGAGSGRPKEAWRSLVRQLVATGRLRIAIDGFGNLSLTGRGRDLMHGRDTFLYRPDAPAPKGAARPQRQVDEPLDSGDRALFDVLRALRLELAKERGVPAYIVFTDRTLIDMARRRPRTREEFARVSGVGEVKMAEFAESFLEAIDGTLAGPGSPPAS